MVLQQNQDVAFWGTFTPNKEVTISGSWGEESTSVSDENGNWKRNTPTPEIVGPFEVNEVTKVQICLTTYKQSEALTFIKGIDDN